jgi:hypothetical protein
MNDEDFPELSVLIGKHVRLGDGSGDSSDTEYGVIVHAWKDSELDVTDCYVTFFGNKPLQLGEKPNQQPYTLRYFLSSLEECK